MRTQASATTMGQVLPLIRPSRHSLEELLVGEAQHLGGAGAGDPLLLERVALSG